MVLSLVLVSGVIGFLIGRTGEPSVVEVIREVPVESEDGGLGDGLLEFFEQFGDRDGSLFEGFEGDGLPPEFFEFFRQFRGEAQPFEGFEGFRSEGVPPELLEFFRQFGDNGLVFEFDGDRLPPEFEEFLGSLGDGSRFDELREFFESLREGS